MISVSEQSFENHICAMLVVDTAFAKTLKANRAACDLFKQTHDALSRIAPKRLLPLRAKGGPPADHVDANFSDVLHVSEITYDNRPAWLIHILKPEKIAVENCPKAPDTENALEDLESRDDILAARLRQTQNLAQVGHWEMNTDTGQVYWSDKTCEIFGVPQMRDPRRYPATSSLVHPDDRAAFECKMQQVLKDRAPFRSLHRIIRPDGQVRYVRETGEFADTLTPFFRGLSQDITDIIVAQTEFEKAAALMNDAGEIAKVGGWEYDAHTGIVSRTPMVAEIVGTPGQLEIPLVTARQLYKPEYIARHKRVWADCLEKGIRFDEVMEIVAADGAHRWVRISGTPVWNADKTEITHMRGALQDITEIVLARQQTEAMSVKLEETLEGISDSFMIINHDWEVTFANEGASRLMGLPKADMLGQYLWKLFPESEGGEFHQRYEQIMKDGETQRFVAKSQQTGNWLFISAYATSHGLAISARDVSEQHERDQQLRLLETAVSRLNDIVMITEQEPDSTEELQKFVFANQAFERVMGFTLDEIIGKTAEVLRGPETQPEEIDKLGKATLNGEPARSEIINYTKSGKLIWLELDIVPILQPDGIVSHWVSVARDITDRKKTEQRLRLSEERFRLVAGASNDVIWDCDLKSGKMWWNDKLLRVFGHDASQFTDKLTWWDANIHPDEQKEILRNMQDIIDGSDEYWKLKYRFRRSDGSYAHVLDRGSVLRDENGKATRILGNMTDISERLRLEDQLRQSQKMEAIGKLTGGVAHDFNNLLAIIMGNLELLKEEMKINRLPPEDTHELIDAGIAAVQRGSDLTHQMLSYARKARLAPEETNLNTVVRETESWVRRTIDSNIEIKTTLDSELKLTRVDTNSLQNAIVNLLLNARDAMKAGGTIFIETANVSADDPRIASKDLPHAPHGLVMLSISDNGPGIAPENLDRVFDPFFTTKPVGEGSGLGLSMVQGFVSQSEGVIQIFSEANLGTTVSLCFKALAPQHQDNMGRRAGLKDANQSSAQTQPAGRILLAEDEPDVRKMLARTLSNAGYSVVTAKSGDEALGIFSNDTGFDLVLTDISMPGSLDGNDLAKACRALSSEVPIILLSGHASETSNSGASELRGSKRLMKPLLRQHLIEAVRQSVLERSPRGHNAQKKS
jgi:PAS domain S-box-containing protein